MHWTKKGAATDDPDAHAWGIARAASAAEDLPSGDFSTAVAFLAANSAKERAVFLYERLNDIRDYFAMEEEMRESAEAGGGRGGGGGGRRGDGSARGKNENTFGARDDTDPPRVRLLSARISGTDQGSLPVRQWGPRFSR